MTNHKHSPDSSVDSPQRSAPGTDRGAAQVVVDYYPLILTELPSVAVSKPSETLLGFHITTIHWRILMDWFYQPKSATMDRQMY